MVRAAIGLYRSFGLPGAGLILLLEGIGVPIPVEIPLSILGLRIAQGQNSYWQIVWLMCIASAVGNTIGYGLGYFGGRPLALRLLSWFRVKPEVWDRLEDWFQKHGLKVVLATRWMNWGFAQNMWLCGITRVPFGRFLVVMLLNDFFWAMGWTWVARTAMTYVQRTNRFAFLHHSTNRVGMAVLAAVALLITVWALVRWFQNRKK